MSGSTVNSSKALQKISVQDLKLPNNDVGAFKQYFSLGNEDEKRLAAMGTLAKNYSHDLIEAFYDHVLAQPELALYFQDPQVLERAKKAQALYFAQLTTGIYDTKYLESRLVVGEAHNRVNLPAKWYVGAYSFYIDGVADQLAKTFENAPKEAYAFLRSFIKVVFFDMAVAMETFIIQRERQLEQKNEALKAAEELSKSIINAGNNIAIFSFTKDGLIQTWNNGAESVFGYGASEIVGQDIRRFYLQDDLNRGLVEREMHEAGERKTISTEGWKIAKNGRQFFAKASFCSLFNSDGQLNGYVMIVLDNTEQKRAHEKMEAQQKQVTELVAALSTVTSRLSSVASQLAASTAESVAATTQTTATAEEIRRSAEQTSTTAKNVSADARAVVVVSKRGQESTNQTIKAMVHIREQIDSIADCMIRLSDQSKLIGDIIATVDDLAQQSNLLAVNASIEAAKAGEQGKGFAVVAQEVKNLSQQSKAATAHVRSILNDVLKATTAATMATEQGSKAVESGHQQASEAGAVIKTLAENIEESARATELIEIASQEQLIGMKQMVDGMESIKLAAVHTEQSAGQVDVSTQELSSIGMKLSELTAQAG